jgi:hypothetical protein
VPSHKQTGAVAAAPAAETHDTDTPASRAGAPTYRDSPHFKLGQAAYATPRKPAAAASESSNNSSTTGTNGAQPTARPTSSRRPPGGASTFTFG